MRVPSRRLPPFVPPPLSPAWRWGCLLGLLAVAGIVGCLHPLGTLIFLGVTAPAVWLAGMADRRYRKRLVARMNAGREGDALCRFAREFDCRAVDTWLIRATFEEVQGAYHGVSSHPVPVRAADRWEEDLRIDGDDLDEIGGRVAQRAGYHMDDCRHNPLYGKVKTVGDLVAFLCHQPCTRAA